MYDNDRRDDNHKHESDWLLHEVHNVTQPRNRKQNFPNYVSLWSLCAVLGIVCITLRLIYNASFNRLTLCYTVSGWYICLGVLPPRPGPSSWLTESPELSSKPSTPGPRPKSRLVEPRYGASPAIGRSIPTTGARR